MDRKNWNWDEDRELNFETAGDGVSFSVDDILAEFWSSYSEPEEAQGSEYETEYEETYEDPAADEYGEEYEDTDGDGDSFDFTWEPEEATGKPLREQEAEEETEGSFPLWEPKKEIAEKPKREREQETVEALFQNIRAYFRRNENKKNDMAKENAVPAADETRSEEKPDIPTGRPGKKGVVEQFPDSPPEEPAENFVDDFDYSSLFKMFADPEEEKADRPPQKEDHPEALFSEGYFEIAFAEEADEPVEEETPEEETVEEQKPEGPRPLLAEDSMDFRDILREFMLGDQHPIYADIPGIGARSEKGESILPMPEFPNKEEEKKTEKIEPEENYEPRPRRRYKYDVKEDFPTEPEELDVFQLTGSKEPQESEIPEETDRAEDTAEPEPGKKRSKREKTESGKAEEVQENVLLRMLRGFGGPTGSKKKALNAPSAYAGYEDYLPEENPEKQEGSEEQEKPEEQDPGKETAVYRHDGDDRTEEEDDELLYSGDFPPFWQWILNELMNLWIRINGIGDRASTFTMEDEHENLGTEVNVANASRYYGSQVTMLRMRFQIGLALLAVLAYLTLGFPVSGMLKTAKVTAAMCLGLQLTTMLLCLDVVTNAAVNLTRGKFGADTLAVLCCVISSLDALTVALGSFGTPHIPLCLFSSLALLGILFASLLSARGLRKSIRVPAIGKRAYCVTAEEGVRANRDITLLKSVRPTIGFVRRSEEAPPDETLFSKIALFELLAAIVLALFTGIVKHSMKDMLFILSAILSCAVPLTALLAFALPFFIGSQRIFSSGAAVAGWSGIHDIGSSRNLIVTDRDLFPEETVSIDTVRIFADESAERVIAYAGTMIAASGSGLGPCFAELMEKNGARMRQVEDFQWLSGGGLQGRIEGHRVLCGSSDLMQLMDVKIPYRLVDRTTVLLAIDGVLYGIFKINYLGLPEVRTALQDLIASNRHPIFAIRDFIVTPEMLRETFDVATDGYDFPPFGDRFRISEAQPSETSKIAAVVCREGLGPLTHLADTGRSMYIAVRLNLIITVLAAVLGILLVFLKLVGTGLVNPWLPLILMLLDLLAVTMISLFMRF